MSKQAIGSNGPHWMESGEEAGPPRRVLMALLGLFLVIAIIAFVIITMRTSTVSRAVFAAWYVADYDDRVLVDLPFARENAEELAKHWNGEARPLDSAAAKSRGLDFDALKSLNAELDVAVVYLRAYGRGVLQDGKPQAEILASGFKGDASTDERLAFADLCSRLASSPAAAVVLILDCGELESNPTLGVLAADFAFAVESQLKAHPEWNRVWVINSQGTSQPAHISWQQHRTLLGATIADHAWKSLDTEGSDGSVSLAELYEAVLRDSASLTGNLQAPLLLRGGVGAVPPRAGQSDWEAAKSIAVWRPSLADLEEKDLKPATKEPDPAGNAPEPAGNDTAQAGLNPALDGTFQSSVDRSTLEVRLVNFQSPTDNSSNPLSASAASVSSDGQNSNESAVVGASSSDPASSNGQGPSGNPSAVTRPPTFDEAPLQATWAAHDRLVHRQTAGNWAPADYAPAAWGRAQRELISLDHQIRQGDPTEKSLKELRVYHDLFQYFINPATNPPSLTGTASTEDLVKGYSAFEASPNRRLWEDDRDLRSTDIPAWRATQRALRIYSDAMSDLTWWIELAARTRDATLRDQSAGLATQLQDLQPEILSLAREVQINDLDLGKLSSQTDRIRSQVEQLGTRVNDLIAEPRLPWQREWLDAQLLTSPLVTGERRRKLHERTSLSPTNSDNERVIPRLTELEAVWQSAARREVDWSFFERQANTWEQLLKMLDDAPLDATVNSEQASLRWGQLYQGAVVRLVGSSGEENTADASLATLQHRQDWHRAALLGPFHARFEDSGELSGAPRWTRVEQTLGALTPPPALDNTLRVSPGLLVEQYLTVAGQWSQFENMTLYVPGEGACDRVKLRLAGSIIGNQTLWNELELACRDADGKWILLDRSLLAGDGQLVNLPRSGALSLRARAVSESSSTTDPSEPVRVPLNVEPRTTSAVSKNVRPANVTLAVRPPRPNHVDLWVTVPSTVATEESASARRGIILPALGFDVLAADSALVAIPGATLGVPYRVWAENQSRRDLWIRASIFTVTLPADAALRPGRLRFNDGTFHDAVSSLIARINRGASRPWAISQPVRLKGKSDTTNNDVQEGALAPDAVPLGAWTFSTPSADQPAQTDASRGLIVMFEEMEPPVAPAEGSAPAPQRVKTNGGQWFKVVEFVNHPLSTSTLHDPAMIDLALASDPNDPTSARYDAERGRLSMEATATTAWARYGIEQMPVDLAFINESGALHQVIPKNNKVLSDKAPRVTLEGRLEPLPRSATRQLFALNLAGFPRQLYYELSLSDSGQAKLLKDPNFLDARLLNVDLKLEEVPPEQTQHFSRLPRGDGQRDAIVLWNKRMEADLEVTARYQDLVVQTEIDAPWTTFQDFGNSDTTYTVAATLRSENGVGIARELRYAPRDEQFTLNADPKNPDFLRVTSSVADHTFRLPPRQAELAEGNHEVIVSIQRGDEILKQSTSQRIIVDRTPPDRGSILAVGPQDSKLSSIRLFAGQKMEARLQTRDLHSRVESVEFKVVIRPGETITRVGTPIDEGRNQWAVIIEGDEFAKLQAPAKTYQMTAVAIDLAGNRQTTYSALNINWQAKEAPKNSSAAIGEPPVDNKKYAVSFQFTRNGNYSIDRPNLISSIKIKGLGGTQSVAGSSIRFGEIPAGEYKVEFTADWDRKNWLAEEVIQLPRDAEKNFSINLEEKKD